MRVVVGAAVALVLVSGVYLLGRFSPAAPESEPVPVPPKAADSELAPAIRAQVKQAADVSPVPPVPPRQPERISLSGPELCHEYSVRSGETAASIAQTHGISVGRLLAANPELEGKAFVERGEVLNIPCIIVEEQSSQTRRPAPTERYKITSCEKGRTKNDWEMPVASVVSILRKSLSNDAFEWAVEAYWQCAEQHHSPLVSLNVTREVNNIEMAPNWMVDVASLAVGTRKWIRVVETPASSYTAHVWERVGEEYVQYYVGGPYVFAPCLGEDSWDATSNFFSFRMRDEWSRLSPAVRKFVCNEVDGN